jgi:hypothetical protein
MDDIGPRSEYVANLPASVEAPEMTLPSLEQPFPVPEEPPQPPAQPARQPLPLPPVLLPPQPALRPPQSPPPPEQAPAPVPGPTPAAPTGAASTLVFRLERGRQAALYTLNWRRLRLVLWLLVAGVALGFLLFLPPARSALAPLPPVHQPTAPHAPHVTVSRPILPLLLVGIGVGAPLLALLLGLCTLPLLLGREVWLRRQRDLHLALGRQGLLFFLPGRPGCWFLLPWGHISQLNDVTIAPVTGRRARLRTVLWRRVARLRRAFRHGRHLGESAERSPRRGGSPFTLHARREQPRQMVQVVCYARLPARGYNWLFRLAPFTQREGPTSFLLETGWFESARPPAAPVKVPQAALAAGDATQPMAIRRPAPTPALLHRLLQTLWAAPLSRAQRPALPLPRSGGAVILSAVSPALALDVEARQRGVTAWAALALVPALSVVGLIIALAAHQPPDRATVLNVATLSVLTLGLGLLLAGVRPKARGSLFVSGAALLALAGVLNLLYGLVANLLDWPWPFRVAPGEPLLFLALLAGLLIALGAGALALEGSGRPGARPTASLEPRAPLGTRAHSAELALALGLLALALGRVLEDIDRATLSSSSAALILLRNMLAEPLLPLAVLGLSYFAPLADASLRTLFRALQIIYGVALALLVPGAFIVEQRATRAKGLLPLPWLPLLILALLCGTLIVLSSLLSRQRGRGG